MSERMNIIALHVLSDAEEMQSERPTVAPPRACADSFGRPCPFAELRLDGEQAYDGSGDEHYFHCKLLGDEEVERRVRSRQPAYRRHPELVWGEGPVCTSADWVARIKAELGGRA